MTVTQVGTPAAPTVQSASNTGAVTPSAYGTGQTDAAGDLLVCAVTAYGSTTAGAITESSGTWTKAVGDNTQARTSSATFYKVAAGSDALPTFNCTMTGTATHARMTVQLFQFHGQDPTTPIDLTNGIGTADSATATSLTVTSAGNIPAAGCYALTSTCEGNSATATLTFTRSASWANAGNTGSTSTYAHSSFDTFANPASGAALSNTAGGWAATNGAAAVMVVVQPVSPTTASGSLTLTGTAAANVPETSPALELSGFGTFSAVGAGDTINHVTVAVTEHQSNAAQAAATFELWDYSGTPAQIGTTRTGTASTSTSNVSTATFTGVTYAQLATLRVRVYGHANTGTSYVESVDAVSLTVNYTPVTTAAGSLAITGTAAAAAPATASGALALTGTAAAKAPATAAGTLALAGTATAAGPGASAAGTLTLTGTGPPGAAVSASGALALTGSASTAGPVWSNVNIGTVSSISASPLTLSCPSTTQHNLLTCVISNTTFDGAPTLPAGWVLRASADMATAGQRCGAWIFEYADNPGGITSVSVTFSSGTVAGQISEWTAANVSRAVADQTGSATGSAASSALPVASSGVLTAADELAVTAFALHFTANTATTLSAGAGFTQSGQIGNTLVQAGHATFDYDADTGAAGATVTDSAGNSASAAGGWAGALATYIIGSAGPVSASGSLALAGSAPAAARAAATGSLALAGSAAAAGPAAFPSRLACSGQQIVDANGFPVPVMFGFDVQVLIGSNTYDNATFAAMAAEAGVTAAKPGLIRMAVFWDQFEPTGPNTLGTGISSTYQAALDTQIANAVANNFYVYVDLHLLSNHFPSWASTVTSSPAHALVNYVANGQNITQWLANRYGNPASPQYNVAVIGFGINEPAPPQSDFNTAAIQANIVAGQVTGAGWVRSQAPNWIIGLTGCYGVSAPVPNASGSGQTTQTFTAVSATPLSGVTPPGNFFWDTHDEVMGTTDITTPGFDHRLSDGRPPASTVAIKLGDATYNSYPPVVSGSAIPRATLKTQQAAFWAAIVAYCAPGYANCPMFMGEHGWNATVDTSGQAAYLQDKLPLWASLGGVGVVARCEWDYATVQATDGWAARPGSGASGADANGWQTWTNLAFIGGSIATGALDITGSVTAKAAASATGAITLTGTGAPGAPVSATGAVSITGTAAGQAPAAASGSLSLTGAAAWQAPASAGSLTLTGTAAAKAPVTASAALALAGSAAAAAPVTAAGTVSLAGTAAATQPGTSASGSLALAGTSTAQAPAAAAGALALAGASGALAPASAAGSLALAGTAATMVAAVTGSLALAGTSAALAPASAAGSLAIAGTAVTQAPPSAGAITLSGTAAARAPAAGAGALSLAGTVTAAAPVTAAGSVVLTGTATALGPGASAAGTLALAGTAAAGTQAIAAGSVTLAGTAAPAAQVTATGLLALTGTGAVKAAGLATANLVLAGTAITVAPVTAAGGMALAGTATGSLPRGAAGNLALAGNAIAPASPIPAGILSLAGTAAARSLATAGGQFTLTGLAAAAASAHAAGSLTLAGAAFALVPPTGQQINALGAPARQWAAGVPVRQWAAGVAYAPYAAGVPGA